MRSTLLLSVALVFILTLSAEGAAIRSRAGEVWVTRTLLGPYLPLSDTHPLRPGDIFKTGAGGRLTIQLLAGSLITLGPSAEARYDGEKFSRCHVTHLAGRLAAQVERLPRGTTFSTSTPIATLGVRGTEFTLELDPGGFLAARVETGVVAAYNSETAALIGAGELLTADPFAGLSPVTPAAAADLAQWRDLQQYLLANNPDSVTERFRPIVWRELGAIRVEFDRILALYELHRVLGEGLPDTPADQPAYYGMMSERLRQEAGNVYQEIIEGRGRLDATAFAVHQLKERYGAPAAWIDEALVSYRGIWDGWLQMLDGFTGIIADYENRSRGTDTLDPFR